MKIFNSLRITEWRPKFTWVDTPEEAADLINLPHEDYPDRIPATLAMLKTLGPDAEELWNGVEIPGGRIEGIKGVESLQVTEDYIRVIHDVVFSDTGFGGRFRDTEVTIGRGLVHRPPDHTLVQKFIEELAARTRIWDIEDLTDWYSDFETIHPFLDGNGRVGGIIVAGYSHGLEPRKGWMAPCQ